MRKIIFRLSDEDFVAFRVKLAQEGRTAQDVLTRAVVDYLTAPEGAENKGGGSTVWWAENGPDILLECWEALNQ